VVGESLSLQVAHFTLQADTITVFLLQAEHWASPAERLLLTFWLLQAAVVVAVTLAAAVVLVVCITQAANQFQQIKQ
jgi:hypothetical protein